MILYTALDCKHVLGLIAHSTMQALSIQQKQAVVNEYTSKLRQGIKLTKSALAQWAKTALKLTTSPNQSTICRILQDSNNQQNLSLSKNIAMRRNRAAAAPGLEEALYKWICIRSNRGGHSKFLYYHFFCEEAHDRNK